MGKGASDLAAMHRSELEATVVDQAKLLERFRRSIANVVREFEDEGDRVYLGSTNDADDLRALDESLTDRLNSLACPWTHGHDLYAEIRSLRNSNRALLGAVRKLAGNAGALKAFEIEIREVAGNTNWQCLVDAIAYADEVSARAKAAA